ncbi:alpha-amylase [Aquimarina addita]|uniref:Alpha-amylase n=1 Tax=Aquimarina addita TaxID=870485 RepID=A0ABP6UUW3_9FLAO
MMKFFKTHINRWLVVGCMGLSFIGCSDDEMEENPTPAQPEATDFTATLAKYTANDGVMMQAFYWDVTPQGDWYDIISAHIEDWKTTGVNRIWLPPPSKGQSGFSSMGYDPSDYFDLGEFDQHGTVETRFGSKAELKSLIDVAHQNDIEVIADIVLGHNSGGGLQANPFRDGAEVYSLFNEANGNASGKFNRTNEHFHPNDIHQNDEQALFFAETDLCHDQPYVQDWLWKRDDSFAEYLKSFGFDGWRFDYVKSFSPEVIKEWNEKVGGFSVGENFDGNSEVLENWVEASGSTAFDFACFYKLDEALDRHQDLTYLDQGMLRKTYPDQAVTFTANHDTEKDENPDNRISLANKLKAYAYILTHDGYPCIFYSDYENIALQAQLKGLIAIYNSLATGAVEVLKISEEEYIMKREGNADNPGLILYINIDDQSHSFDASTNWNNKELVDYAGNVKTTITVDANGAATLTVPANSFTIWSVME